MAKSKICLREAALVYERQQPQIEEKRVKINEAASDHGNEQTMSSDCGNEQTMSLSEVYQILKPVPNDNSTHKDQMPFGREYSPLLFDSPSEKEELFHLKDNLLLNASASNSQTSAIPSVAEPTSSESLLRYVCPPECYSLKECAKRVEECVSIFALAVEVGQITELTLKTGQSKGQIVNTSSLILSDPTYSNFKVTLWRDSAFWAERLSAGDIILLTNIRLKEAKSAEVFGHTVADSGVLNLHQPKVIPIKLLKLVPRDCFRTFTRWARKEYHYLFSYDNKIPRSQRVVNFTPSGEISSAEGLVHFRGKLISVNSQNVLTVSDTPGVEILLRLVGYQNKKWKESVQKGVGLVWEIKYLQALPEGTQAGVLCLQTTSWSSFHCLERESDLAKEILQKWSCSTLPIDTSILDIVRFTRSGTYRVKALSTEINIIGSSSKIEFVPDPIGFSEKLKLVLPDMLYVGCGHCATPLFKEKHNAACICQETNPKVVPISTHYYRPLLIHLSDGSGSREGLDIVADHTAINKILSECGATPSLLGRSSSAEISEVLLQKISCTMSVILTTSTLWIIHVAIVTDQNSFVTSFKSTLLEWKQYL